MGLISALLVAAGLAIAPQQTNANDPSQFKINVDGVVGKTTGGDQGSAGAGTGPIQLGKASNVILSMSKDSQRCGFSARGAGSLESNANLGWTATVTPTRVDGEAVTFTIKWARAIANDKPSSGIGGEEQITLRVGEKLTLDSVVHPGADACRFATASLVVNVERTVNGWLDARLVETDIWLVEYLPNGKEESQHVVVRSQLYVWTPFFFDAIQANRKLVDHHGEFLITPGAGYLEVQLLPRRRVSDPGVPPKPTSDLNSTATLRLKPQDVGEWGWQMPPNDPLGGRKFSIRIQVRQIR